jgi:hypothetical protein
MRKKPENICAIEVGSVTSIIINNGDEFSYLRILADW